MAKKCRPLSSSVLSSLTTTSVADDTPLRRGKWTVEEEKYVAQIIHDFNSGFLDASAGITLRSYLSEKLHCDPMRITKKFTGDSSVGKRIFNPAVRCVTNTDEIDKAQAHLATLEKQWRRRLDIQQRQTTKAMSSVTNSIPFSHDQLQRPSQVSTSSSVFRTSGFTFGSPAVENTHGGMTRSRDTGMNSQEHILMRTAEWLHRATHILSCQVNLEHQIPEVINLINEGSLIQKKTSAGFSSLLGSSTEDGNTSEFMKKTEVGSKRSRGATEDQSDVHLRAVPEDRFPPPMKEESTSEFYSEQRKEKKPRRSFSSNGALPASTGTKDAEAFVSFLNTVRQESRRPDHPLSDGTLQN